MKYTYFFIFFLFTFFACQNDSIPERVTFKSTPLDEVYQDLRPEVQEFSISNNQPNKIKAAKGTEIFVPENSFVDANGNPIKGKVEVKIIEAFSLEDFITSGLVTQSNGQLLISNGMINIDASAGGQAVELQEGKELTVSMPTMEKNMEGFQMFTGDGQNWEVDSSMMEEDYLIPVPLELLYPEGNFRLLYYLEGGFSFQSYFEENNISLENEKYEKTLIATEAFQNRLQVLFMMTYNMSILEAKEYYMGDMKWKERKFNLSLWKTYFENLDKPIEELDKLARQKYVQYLVENEEALIQFSKDIKEQKNGDYHFPWIYCNGELDDYSKENFLSILDYFSFTEKGRVKFINDHGVDLTSKNISQKLEERGLTSNEVNEILTFNFKRNSIIEKLERRKKIMEEREAQAKQRIEDRKKLTEYYETTSFSAKKLGWINCDRFYDSPEAKEAKILASNSSKIDLNFIDFSLIFPKMNARLSASKNEEGKYAFTSSGRYSKLPIGEKAIVTAISFQDDSIFYAAQEIIIEENMQLDLNLEFSSKEELPDALSKLLD
ncbi:MAG: hypothetical protein AB8F94_25575 [Saprospiraceae bacterium]